MKSIRITAAIAAAGLLALAGCSSAGDQSSNGEDVKLEFWTQIYGDPAEWRTAIEGIAADFEEQTGTAVEVEFIDFAQSRDRWMLVAQGADAPDVGDMTQLHSNAALGGGKVGPMAITDYKDEYWPDLEERFAEPLLVDAQWNGEFYGIPWRTDPRAMLYRTDLLEAAGFSEPPSTWEEVRKVAKALTKDGQYGYTFSSAEVVQGLVPALWQAGEEYMSEDGTTATLDTPEMRKALDYMKSLVDDGSVPPDFMDPNYDPMVDFKAGRVAMIGAAGSTSFQSLIRDNPELEGKWAAARIPAGPENSASYTGSGYWGVLHGTEHPDEAVEFIAFLSNDENMQTISEVSGWMSTNKAVMASDFWTSEDYQSVFTEILAEDAHTSQYPSPFWPIIREEKPGGVLWDLFSAVLISGENADTAIATAEKKMQEILDRAKQ